MKCEDVREDSLAKMQLRMNYTFSVMACSINIIQRQIIIPSKTSSSFRVYKFVIHVVCSISNTTFLYFRNNYLRDLKKYFNQTIIRLISTQQNLISKKVKLIKIFNIVRLQCCNAPYLFQQKTDIRCIHKDNTSIRRLISLHYMWT